MQNWLAHTRMKPFDGQVKAFNHLYPKRLNALFSDPGTGKTKICFDLICSRAMEGLVDTVIIFAWPSQIHHQWIEEQLPKHWWHTIKHRSYAWDGKKLPSWFFDTPAKDTVNIFTFNIESTISKKVVEPLLKLVTARGQRVMLCVDESQTIKNKSSNRWKVLHQLGLYCKFKMIMTGTPMSKNLLDQWAQYFFLDERIIGIKYKTAFQQMFCEMGGFQGKVVIKSKNVETFNRLVAPYSFRATKDELGLPPKMPAKELVFNLTHEQKLAQEMLKQTFILEYDALRKNFDTDVPVSQVMSVVNVGSLFVKLQQIASGFFADNEGKIEFLKENPRLDLLKEFLSEYDEDKFVIWCRFRQDIETIKAALGPKAVVYYGGINDAEKRDNKQAFLNDNSVKYFVANPASAGTGMDGLQTVASKAIYYTNSFNLLDRIQSEDRTNRPGSKETSFYYDLVGRGSIDRHIMRNITAKRQFSDMTLGALKGIIDAL